MKYIKICPDIVTKTSIDAILVTLWKMSIFENGFMATLKIVSHAEKTLKTTIQKNLNGQKVMSNMQKVTSNEQKITSNKQKVQP